MKMEKVESILSKIQELSVIEAPLTESKINVRASLHKVCLHMFEIFKDEIENIYGLFGRVHRFTSIETSL